MLPLPAGPLVIQGPGGVSFSAEYQAALTWAQANGVSPPSRMADKIREDTLVRALVACGAWAKTDQIFLLNTYGDATWAVTNLKNPGTLNGSYVGNGLYTPGKGYTSIALAGAYIDSNFIPSSSGVNFTQNECGVVFYCPSTDNPINDNSWGGASDGSATNGIYGECFSASSRFIYALNHATSISLVNTSSPGLYHVKRTGSTTSQAYKNAVSLGTSATATTGLSTRSIAIGAYKDTVSAGQTSKYTGFWMIGASFTGLEAAINTAWSAYLASDTDFDTITLPTFPTYTTFNDPISNFVAALAQLNNQGATVVHELLTGLTTGPGLTWQGAVAANNDIIYAIPSSGTQVLKINTTNDTWSLVGSIPAGTQKWAGGVFIGHYIYFFPYNATSVGKWDINNDTITYFDTTGVVASPSAGNLTGTLKWGWSGIGSNGKIYGMPFDATSVLIIDPSNDSIQFMDTTGIIGTISGNLTGAGKWDSSQVYGDYIYGMPSNSTGILKINTSNNTCAIINSGTYPGTNAYGLSTIAPNGKIYFGGYSQSNIRSIDPNNGDAPATLSLNFGGTGASYPGGSALLPDGRIFYNPYNMNGFYIFDNVAGTLTKSSFTNSIGANCLGAKLARNGAIYSIPLSGNRIFKTYLLKKRYSPSYDWILNRNINIV